MAIVLDAAVDPLRAFLGAMPGGLYKRRDAGGGGLVVLLQLSSAQKRGHEDRPLEDARCAGGYRIILLLSRAETTITDLGD